MEHGRGPAGGALGIGAAKEHASIILGALSELLDDEEAPFDRVILTAAPPVVPEPLLEQLADGGVLVAPVGEEHGTQWLVRMRKKDGKLTKERLGLVRFVPMVPGR